ncbi:fucose-1-phosphate guanylyltransferase isoform X1 [Hydra vulgaris]|uniref:fucose-1-phosphate guanylyltransferase isoform X1 n=1 Tax=Hydra vulgaris TaxID=6087 RepID=UPI001F5E522F|nr:fucose-1-phosphate guanylyltransferase [Hydra vulgaris]
MADFIIKNATFEKIVKFNKMRGKYSSEIFWDVVVLSALDCDQKNAFEMQIKEKIERKELPLSPTYHVMHDPVGVKVGNGGAVIAIIDELNQIYGEKLETLKVIIFLSGGYSQRLPSASALGKIFTALPFGDPIYQMIEVKLALFVDFPKRMNAGIFVASSDCFELYHLDGDEWNFTREGVTALAHCSPIEVGLTHGVYVLDDLKSSQLLESNSTTTKMSGCKRFLHKPSKELMRSQGAVFINDSKEYIYSDSAYYMDNNTAKLLLNWYKMHGPLACEIDAYGDFLQSLGSAATSDYCRDVKNVTVVLDELEKTRLEIFNVLKGTPLNIILLDKSKFYHIGTTQEYIYHFCIDNAFREELSCLNHVMLKTDSGVLGDRSKQHILIHSYIPDLSCIGNCVIVEYSILNADNKIGDNCIISNCSFPNGACVPSNTFLHTIPLSDSGKVYYVTLVFDVTDDLKTSVTSFETGHLQFCGKTLKELVFLLHINEQHIWPETCPSRNLWNAKIYPAYSDPAQSLQAAIDIKTNLLCPNFSVFNYGGVLYSISDVLKKKNLCCMLDMRAKLRDLIEK